MALRIPGSCRNDFRKGELTMDIYTIQEEAYKRGYEAAQPKWIPVTERLPDKDGDYLVFKRFDRNAWSDVVSFAKDGRKVSKYTFEKKWQNIWYCYDSEWGYIRTDAVTHWMPLPEPPKGE